MVICFPVEIDNGLDSKVYGHFGSAPMFITYNSNTESINKIDNQNLNHAHGQCSPIQALNGQLVDAIVVGGIGGGAINKLNNMGIKVYQAKNESIKDNIDLFVNNSLPEITINQACRQHGGCGH